MNYVSSLLHNDPDFFSRGEPQRPDDVLAMEDLASGVRGGRLENASL